MDDRTAGVRQVASHQRRHHPSHIVGGSPPFFRNEAFADAPVVLLADRHPPAKVLAWGYVALAAGLGLTAVAIVAGGAPTS